MVFLFLTLSWQKEIFWLCPFIGILCVLDWQPFSGFRKENVWSVSGGCKQAVSIFWKHQYFETDSQRNSDIYPNIHRHPLCSWLTAFLRVSERNCLICFWRLQTSCVNILKQSIFWNRFTEKQLHLSKHSSASFVLLIDSLSPGFRKKMSDLFLLHHLIGEAAKKLSCINISRQSIFWDEFNDKQ